MISKVILGYPQPLQGRPPGGGLGGARGGKSPKIKCYVNFWVLNSGNFKNDIFILGSPQPPQGRLKGALGGHRGYIDVILILGFSIVGIQF